MTNIGERVYINLTEQYLIIRIKRSFFSVLITTIGAVIIYNILYTYWIFMIAGLHAFLEYFGFCDFIIDKQDQVVRKRYGIGKYILGDTSRFDFQQTEIIAKLTYDVYGDGLPKGEYSIILGAANKIIEIYSTTDLKLTKELFKQLKASGIPKVEWEVEEDHPEKVE